MRFDVEERSRRLTPTASGQTGQIKFMQPPEIKILINATDLIEPEVQAEREQLILNANGIKSVSSAEQNALAGKSVVAMRKHVKDTTSERMTITRRFDDAKKIVIDFFNAYNSD